MHVPPPDAPADRGADVCPFCGGDAQGTVCHTSTNEGETFNFERCGACRGVFLSPMPSASRLDAAYEETYYGERASKFVGPVEWVIGLFRGRRAARVARLLPAGGRVLDIGCGNGQFLGRLAARGHEAYGIEIPGKAAERAATVPGVQVQARSLARGDHAPGSFDVVTLWHVFEHLREPHETLGAIRELLKPGGYLFLSLPNIDSWQARLFGGRWLHHDPPRHLFYLGPKELEGQLRQLSFSRAQRSFVSLEHNPFGFQQSILNCILARRDVLYDALKGDPRVRAEEGRVSLFFQKVFFVTTFPFFALLSLMETLAGYGGTMEFVFRKDVGS
ncbi:MAG: class I SAM-dependent methyltransferase [bacterium]|nr:class I SAM-dependent methyltransferase [bacterium]